MIESNFSQALTVHEDQLGIVMNIETLQNQKITNDNGTVLSAKYVPTIVERFEISEYNVTYQNATQNWLFTMPAVYDDMYVGFFWLEIKMKLATNNTITIYSPVFLIEVKPPLPGTSSSTSISTGTNVFSSTTSSISRTNFGFDLFYLGIIVILGFNLTRRKNSQN